MSIALELLTNPMLLFLDEPTSGLDSSSAESLIRILKNLAEEGRTIVCTIHQPSSEVFQLFDDVFWLGAGHLLYSGEVGQLGSYLHNLGFECPSFSNVADYMMKLVTKNEHATSEEVEERISKMTAYHREHKGIPLKMTDDDEQNGDDDGHESDDGASKILHNGEASRSLPIVDRKQPLILAQFFVLLRRSWIQYIRSEQSQLFILCCCSASSDWSSICSFIRDPATAQQRLIQNIIIALFSGLLFLQLGDDQKGTTTNFLCSLQIY